MRLFQTKLQFVLFMGLFFIPKLIAAQYGVELWTDWHELSPKDNSPNSSLTNYTIVRPAAFYWMRLKEHRLEFLPGLSLGFGKYTLDNSNGTSTHVNETSFQIQFPVLIYPFDFKNDCNCPTFKKTGNTFTKGFHFFAQAAWRNTKRNIALYTTKSNEFPIGLGAGLDIAIAHLLTLTPSISYTLLKIEDYSKFDNLISNGSQLYHHELNLGVRLHYRHDYKKKY